MKYTVPGNILTIWDGRDNAGNLAAPGEYYAQIRLRASGPPYTRIPEALSNAPKITVLIKVEFTDAAGKPLASPHRVGITVGANDRTQHLRAVVHPAAEAPNFTLSAGPKLNLTNVSRVGNVLKFDLVGTAARSGGIRR